MKKNDPTQDWLRIAAEARPQMPAPPPEETAPAWFVTRALANRRAARARVAEGPWFAFPGLARAATASTILAVACAVFILSTGGVEAFTQSDFPDADIEFELEALDLP